MTGFYTLVPMLRAAERKSLTDPGHSAAIGAFNVNFFAQAEGILEALRKVNAPGILQASRGACAFLGGPDRIHDMAAGAMRKLGMEGFPVALHLDHGTVETAIACIRGGFSSVMIDVSALNLEQNIAVTREVSELAHRHDL